MATVSTEFKRLFLRELKWSAEDKGISLYDSLKAVARARITSTNGGKSIVATSSNGHSVTFANPGSAAQASPQSIAELCEELLTRYEAAVSALEITPAGDAQDAQILNEILALLEPTHELYTDFSGVIR